MTPSATARARELERAAGRGDLDMAAAIAKDMAREHERPIPLNLALKLLPLVPTQAAAAVKP